MSQDGLQQVLNRGWWPSLSPASVMVKRGFEFFYTHFKRHLSVSRHEKLDQARTETEVVRKRSENILIPRNQSDSGPVPSGASQHLGDNSSRVRVFPGILFVFIHPSQHGKIRYFMSSKAVRQICKHFSLQSIFPLLVGYR